MEERNASIKWLRILFYLEIAILVKSLLGFLPINKDWINWPGRALTAGVIYCMFCMGIIYSRYKTAAILGAIQFVINLLSAIATTVLARFVAKTGNVEILPIFNTCSTLIGTVALVLGWIGRYQLYHAHGDLVAEKSSVLEKKWRNFFWLSLGIGLVTSGASYLLAYVFDSLMTGYTGVVLSTVINNLSAKIVSLICVIYLYRTIGALEKE